MTFTPSEAYYFRRWLEERQPPPEHASALWLAEREAFIAVLPAWEQSWQRSKAIQRELRHTA